MKVLIFASLLLAQGVDDRSRGGGGSAVGFTGAIRSGILYCPDGTLADNAADCILSGSSGYYGAGAGVARNGGDLVLVGGMATHLVTVSSFGAGTAGDTYTAARLSQSDGWDLVTYTAANGEPGLGEWDSGTSEQHSAESLAGMLTAGGPSGITYTAIACGSDWCILIELTDPDIYWFEQEIVDVGPGTVFGAATSGTNGIVEFPGLVQFEKGIQLQSPTRFLGVRRTCDATVRGTIELKTNGMSADDLSMCIDTGGPAYAWTPVGFNPAVKDLDLAGNDITSADRITLKRSQWNLPTTATVTANAAACDWSLGDVCTVDLEGATGAVTITFSNPPSSSYVTGLLLKVIQGTQLGDIAIMPTAHAAGGVQWSAITATNDAVDYLGFWWNGTVYVLTSQLQDVKVIP
jgi:hypothetical protein